MLGAARAEEGELAAGELRAERGALLLGCAQGALRLDVGPAAGRHARCRPTTILRGHPAAGSPQRA